MYLYKRLKDTREDREIEQKEIAELLKTTQQQYSKYETGKQEIPVHHLMTLAIFYKVTMDYLVELTDNKR